MQQALIAPTIAPSRSRIQLRPYQQEAVDDTLKLWDSGILNLIGILPTGCGKTVVFAGLLKQHLGAGQRALVLAHTDELIQQPRERIGQVWPEANVGISKGDTQQVDRQIICGSVQTLKNKKRLDNLLAAGSIDILIIDECHHAVSNSYKTIIKRLREVNPKLRHLGVTATPNRADGKGLIQQYEAIAFERDIWWAVQQGFLAEPVGWAIDAKLDLSTVKERAGDFAEEEVVAALDAANWKKLIIDDWQEHAAGRKTLAFTLNVAMARSLAKAFNDAGIKADWVSGAPYTTTERRREVLRNYQHGDLQVVVNCAVLTEGFDAPETSCVIMAKPTKSAGLWVQCIGRGLRIADDKQNCLVLEFADQGHTACQFTDLLGSGGKDEKKKKDPAAQPASKQEALLLAVMREAGSDEQKGYAGTAVQRVLNILSNISKLAWYEMDGELSLTLDAQRVLVLLPPAGDAAELRVQKAEALKAQGVPFKPEWDLILHHTRLSIDRWQLMLVRGEDVEHLGYGSLAETTKQAEKYVKSNAAKWAKKADRIHGELASSKQMAFMDRLGIKHHGPVTKGVAMNAISHHLSMETLERRGLVSRPSVSEVTTEEAAQVPAS